MAKTERTLSDFEGAWRLTKTIQQEGQPPASYDGSAIWRSDSVGEGLIYQEEGLLTVQGHPPMHTTRSYRWAKGLNVYFDDGRFFHTVPPQGGETSHTCPPDMYHVAYDFAHWPRFEATWRVVGPRKDYVMDMQYERAACPS